MIWTDQYLNQQFVNAGEDIAQKVQCIWQRFTFPIQEGNSVYTLPSFVRSVLRVQYRGYYLDPGNWEDFCLLNPATVWVAPGSPENIETSQGRPLWYALHPTNIYDIRLYPTPSETFTVSPTDDPYSPDNGPHCIIECFRSQDDTDPAGLLPRYVDRRTRKAYALAKAFRTRGPGQSLTAANFYEKKYQYLIQRFNLINQQPYVGKRYTIEDGNFAIDSFRYPKPQLGPRFENVRFR